MEQPKNKTVRKPAALTRPDAPVTSASDSSAQVLRKFRLVFNAVKTHFQQVEKKAGLGGAQVWALSLIHAKPGLGVNDLAHAMDIHQSTASNIVKALIERELIATVKEGSDRRAVQIKALPAGVKVLRRAPGPFTGVLPQALSQLDAKTLKRLDIDLSKLIDLLQADEHGANVPLGQD